MTLFFLLLNLTVDYFYFENLFSNCIMKNKLYSKVMALGGINADNLLEIKDFGFGGAVILGDLWNRFDACSDQDYLAVIEHFKKLKKLAD